ncbi:hypothetical protein [Streptomyces sp. NPDC046197]|uniref:hypothetical protein n=1 Tax=Streptomyces sp. NPDC046197 TaxID=3154337 RepID=UPI0034026DA7
MGTRHSEGGAFARPCAGASGPEPRADAIAPPGLESALGTALRADAFDPPAEERAVAAFRAARDAGAHQKVRTRRRDDWRLRRSPARRSVKAALAAFLASLTLGGVAIAAIGLPGSGKAHDDGPGRARPTSTASKAAAATSDDAAPSGPAGAPSKSRPPTAKDIQAHCRAYTSTQGRGKALDSSAWQRFIAAAGGEDKVAAYCAAQLAEAKADGAAKASARPNSKAGDQKDAGRHGGRQARPN